MNLTRREAVIRMATLMGATVVGPRLFAASFGNATTATNYGFSKEDVALLDEIGDTILPVTDVPGAKATGIGAFIAMMVHDCYGEPNQAAFKDGLRKLASGYASRFGGPFVTGKPADRTAFLNELDEEQKAFTAQKKAELARTPLLPDQEEPLHYFRLMKELTILGYFSSEIGATQALHFTEVPGRFDGNVTYKKGEHAWFS